MLRGCVEFLFKFIKPRHPEWNETESEDLLVSGASAKVKAKADPSTATDAPASVFAQDDTVF